MAEAKVLVPAGMLGAGFTAESVARGIALGADAIAVDGDGVGTCLLYTSPSPRDS